MRLFESSFDKHSVFEKAGEIDQQEVVKKSCITVKQLLLHSKCALMYEANKTNSQTLHQFLAAMTRLVDNAPAEQALIAQVQVLMEPLLIDDDWLQAELTQAHPLHPQQFLIYADPQARFSVVSLVCGPGQSTPIHDHTVWGVMGLLRGSLSCQPYSRMSDGRWVPAGFQIDMLPGDMESVSPRTGDVHKVWNPLPDQVTVCIEIYAGHIGLIERHSYREDGSRQMFVDGYANVHLISSPVQSTAPLVTSATSVSVTVPTTPMSDPAAQIKPADASVRLEEIGLPSLHHEHQGIGPRFAVCTYSQVRQALLEKQEIALVDVREEHAYAQGHPLFAIHLPYGRIEADSARRIPRLDTPIVLFDQGGVLAERAAEIFQRMGYSNISIFQNGLSGWAAAGGELFRDIHVASQAFAELVEHQRKTPSFSAQEVNALMASQSDMVLLDARRFEEYQALSIPGAIHIPGGELVLCARTLASDAITRIVVSCEGRARSIIGAQSLINAGIPNPVCALRNGLLGWSLAGYELEQKADKCFNAVDEDDRKKTAASALALLFRSGVQRIDRDTLAQMMAETSRNTYLLDVRSLQEYAHGHIEGARHAPGGQLIHQTDHYIGVRGARVVVYDDDGVRASMAASWLVQMGWETYVLKDVAIEDLQQTDEPIDDLPDTVDQVAEVDPVTLKEWLANRSNLSMVIDVGDSSTYVKKHIPGAWWLLRSQMAEDFSRVHKANRYVLTCADGRASRFAVSELRALVRPGVEVFWLPGGNAAWIAKGFSTQQGESYVASPRIDRYLRPYEGANYSAQNLQAYLDWQSGLVEQLRRDATHFFKVI